MNDDIVPIDDMRPDSVRLENSAFIAHARTDLPKALRMLELATRKLAEWQAELTSNLDEIEKGKYSKFAIDIARFIEVRIQERTSEIFSQLDQIAKEQDAKA